MDNKCKCGRVLCDLCGKNSAFIWTQNKLNGSTHLNAAGSVIKRFGGI